MASESLQRIRAERKEELLNMMNAQLRYLQRGIAVLHVTPAADLNLMDQALAWLPLCSEPSKRRRVLCAALSQGYRPQDANSAARGIASCKAVQRTTRGFLACRAAVVAFLSLKKCRRAGFAHVDRFLLLSLAAYVWATRACEEWAPREAKK